MSQIYYIQDEGGPIKIGLTHTENNLQSRLSQCQVSNPRKLTLLAVEPGDAQREKDLHKQFSKYHIRGEWFKANKKLKQHIDKLTPLNLVCNGSLWGGSHQFWRGDLATIASKRHRFQKRFPIKIGTNCEICYETKAIDRVCCDRNYENFNRSNVMLLCRKCRMQHDGTFSNFISMIKKPRPCKPISPCANCLVPYKPLRKGLCNSCSCYFGRTGKHRSYFSGHSNTAKYHRQKQQESKQAHLIQDNIPLSKQVLRQSI